MNQIIIIQGESYTKSFARSIDSRSFDISSQYESIKFFIVDKKNVVYKFAWPLTTGFLELKINSTFFGFLDYKLTSEQTKAMQLIDYTAEYIYTDKSGEVKRFVDKDIFHVYKFIE